MAYRTRGDRGNAKKSKRYNASSGSNGSKNPKQYPLCMSMMRATTDASGWNFIRKPPKKVSESDAVSGKYFCLYSLECTPIVCHRCLYTFCHIDTPTYHPHVEYVVKMFYLHSPANCNWQLILSGSTSCHPSILCSFFFVPPVTFMVFLSPVVCIEICMLNIIHFISGLVRLSSCFCFWNVTADRLH